MRRRGLGILSKFVFASVGCSRATNEKKTGFEAIAGRLRHNEVVTKLFGDANARG